MGLLGEIVGFPSHLVTLLGILFLFQNCFLVHGARLKPALMWVSTTSIQFGEVVFKWVCDGVTVF